MAIACPRCGQREIRRETHVGTAAAVGGLAGVLLSQAVAGYCCPSCGRIPTAELPPEVRTKKAVTSIILVLLAVGLIAGAIWLIAAIQRG